MTNTSFKYYSNRSTNSHVWEFEECHIQCLDSNSPNLIMTFNLDFMYIYNSNISIYTHAGVNHLLMLETVLKMNCRCCGNEFRYDYGNGNGNDNIESSGKPNNPSCIFSKQQNWARKILHTTTKWPKY